MANINVSVCTDFTILVRVGTSTLFACTMFGYAVIVQPQTTLYLNNINSAKQLNLLYKEYNVQNCMITKIIIMESKPMKQARIEYYYRIVCVKS